MFQAKGLLTGFNIVLNTREGRKPWVVKGEASTKASSSKYYPSDTNSHYANQMES